MSQEKRVTDIAGRQKKEAVRQKVILHVEPSDLDAGVYFKPA